LSGGLVAELFLNGFQLLLEGFHFLRQGLCITSLGLGCARLGFGCLGSGFGCARGFLRRGNRSGSAFQLTRSLLFSFEISPGLLQELIIDRNKSIGRLFHGRRIRAIGSESGFRSESEGTVLEA